MNLKSVWSFAVILVLLLALPVKAVFAQNSTSQSQMLKMEIKGLSTGSNLVSGNVILTNSSNGNFAQSYLVTRLISPGLPKTITANGQKITIYQPGQLINVSKSDFFSLTPGQTAEQPISLKYPAGIASGEYSLTIEVKDKDGTSQGLTSSKIALSGTGTFLEVSPPSCKIQVGGNTFGVTEGPNVANNQVATISCPVKNNSTQTITAKPQVKYAVNSIGETDQPGSLDLSSQIVVGPGQTGAVKINIPGNLPPQVYEGLLSFVDAGNEQISANIVFRWIVTGASAVIKNLDLDKSYYKSGEMAKISVSALPSVDLSWRGVPAGPGFSLDAGTDLKNPRIVVKVINSDNKICGQKEQQLPPTSQEIYWKSLVMDIPITAECKNPKAEAAIYEEGIEQPLTLVTKGVVTTENDLQSGAPKIAVDKDFFKNPWSWIMIAVLAVMGISGFIFWKKRKKTPPIPPASHSDSATSQTTAAKPIAAIVMLLVGSLGIYLLGQRSGLVSIAYAQQYSPIVGVSKLPVNSTDASLQTITQQKLYVTDLVPFGADLPEWAGIRPLDWANVRDFAQNNTGGDSQVEVSPDCRTIKVTVNGTVGSDYMCANWGPGIAIANFVDGLPVSPTEASSSANNQILIPSLQITNGITSFLKAAGINQQIFNNFSVYGPHIINVHDFGVSSPKSITYKLNLANRLSEGSHKLLLQAGASKVTIHNGEYDRYYSSLEPITASVSGFPQDANCGGTQPCYSPLEYNFTCAAPPACNVSCASDGDCKDGANGCTICRPNAEGQSVCQPPPPACNTACSDNRQCFGNKEGCSSCVPNDSGTGGTCKTPPVCGSSCTHSGQCGGGCSACIGGSCQPPPACGTSCTTKAQCGEAKDGCSECLEGSCTNFSDSMCKCDGMVADMTYPGNAFSFEAFGKVDGKDAKKAEIADVTFRMTKDNQVIAKSNPITPEIVQNDANKVRFKAAWQTAPPAVSRGSTYRVFADVRCKPKRVTADANQTFSPAPKTAAVQKIWSMPPKGLEVVLNSVNKLFGGHNEKVNAVTSKFLALFSTPTANAQGTNLQLQTLNFVKLMDTDNCRFVMFKYDETLF